MNDNTFTVGKSNGTLNPAFILTKHVTAKDVQGQLMDQLNPGFEIGTAAVAIQRKHNVETINQSVHQNIHSSVYAANLSRAVRVSETPEPSGRDTVF